jgi:hypothetical protein
MVDIKTEASTYYGLYKTSIQLVCEAMEIIGTTGGYAQTTIDGGLLELVKGMKMMPNGKAAEFLDHFLYGGGKPKTFQTHALLTQDVRLRTVLITEINRRLQRNPNLVNRMQSGGDFLVPIRQRDFGNNDWRLALGSFPFEWQVTGSGNSPNERLIKVWGANEYKWHPSADRVTQCLHQAGNRLHKAKTVASKNYWMHAAPCILSSPTGRLVNASAR